VQNLDSGCLMWVTGMSDSSVQWLGLRAGASGLIPAGYKFIFFLFPSLRPSVGPTQNSDHWLLRDRCIGNVKVTTTLVVLLLFN
jgi:hypothetical protein